MKKNLDAYKVYVVIGFKKDEKTGYSLPCYLEVFDDRDAAERDAEKFDGFSTVTTKEVR